MIKRVLMLCWVMLACLGLAQAEELVFGQPETAGLCGFRVLWDQVIPLSEEGAIEYTDAVVKDKHPTAVWGTVARKGQPGALAFDALQRSLLVRFPGAAEAIAAKMNQGYAVQKVELVLPFRDNELWPPHGKDFWDPQNGGYTARRNWNVDTMYRKIQPNWHALAWAVRKPWSLQAPELGPTFNANINGASYWEKYGAQGDGDRFATQFGPMEVSAQAPEGRMDVTAMLTDAAFGATVGARLRLLSDSGFLVKKWETYDHRYYNGAYEWGTGTGGRGILIHTPKLVVTLQKAAAAPQITLPPAADVAQLAETLKDGKGGTSTAVMPTEAQILEWDQQFNTKPEWMPAWQWQRVQELATRGNELEHPLFFDQLLSRHEIFNIAGRFVRGKGQQPGSPLERYSVWVDGLIARQPRGWAGFEASREMTEWYRFGSTLPGPARDAILAYWHAWLMPDRPTAHPESARRNYNSTDGALIHPMADDPRVGGKDARVPDPQNGRFDTYYAKTGDWRGNKSFYRSGFCYTISTQNFNTTASSGALLGGAMINAPLAQRDGRNGVVNWLQSWAWNNGSGQEHIDHYYYGITLSGNKSVRDFGPTWFDRLVGESLMAAGIEELVAAYHPGLRRLLAPASRTHLHHLLVTQEGIYSVLHTLSKQGALLDPTQPQNLPKKMPLLGHELTPVTVASQTVTNPWAPAWTSNMVDTKPLPFEATHRNGNNWRRAYLGTHYGLATVDTSQPRIQIMGHWKRDAEVVDQVQDYVTMNLRHGYNDTSFVDGAHGVITNHGSTPVLHHKNKLLVLSSPYRLWANKDGVGVAGSGKPEAIHSVQTSVALYNLQEEPTWKIYIDGKPVEQLPVTARYGQVITIHDGVSYCGIIPLPSPDHGQTAQVVLEKGKPQVYSGITHVAALVINTYQMKRDTPLTPQDNLNAINTSYGGFAVELGDVTEYPTFAAFQQHMQAATVQVQYDAATHTAAATYTSGTEVLQVSRPTMHPKEENGSYPCTMTVNGTTPYPKAGIDRDTYYTQSGKGVRLEKQGASLFGGTQKAFLQVEPESGNYVAWKPRPFLSAFVYELPNGLRIEGDSDKVPMLRVTANVKANTLAVDYAWWGTQFNDGGAAKALLVSGAQAMPSLTVNGQPYTAERRDVEGKPCFIIPLPEVKE